MARRTSARVRLVAGPVLSLLLVLMLPPPLAAAQTTPELSGPAFVTASPGAKVTLTLRLALPGTAESLRLVPSAGVVGPVRSTGPDRFEADFNPPVVATATRVAIHATRGGQRIEAAHFELEVRPGGTVARKRSNGAFELDVPSFLALEAGATADVSVRETPDGPPVLHANVGTLTGFEKRADGRLHASYTPPEKRYPQMAIVVATNPDGSVVDWASFPLMGLPKVKAEGPARAPVRVTVGGTTFGPFIAGNDGKADVSVLVPPGVGEAEVVATDARGVDRKATIGLGTPPFRGGFAVCPPEDEILLYVAVDARGAALRDRSLTLRAEQGAMSPVRWTPSGLAHARFSPPAGAKVGDRASLHAEVANDASTASSCERTVVGETPSVIEVGLDRNAFEAGSNRPIRVTITYRGSGARPLRALVPRLEVSLGTASDPERASPTSFGADWTLPDALSGSREAQIVARAGTKLVSRATLALSSGPTRTIAIQTAPASLISDGRSEATVSVTATDAFGNPVRNAKLAGEAQGSVGSFRVNDDGTYVATYRAPRSTARWVDTVVVREADSGAASRARIELQPGTGTYAAWLRAGYLSNFGKLSTPLAAIGASMRAPWLGERLTFGAEAGFHTRSLSEPDASEAEEISTRITVVPLTALVGFEQPWGTLIPYASLGAGVAIADTRVRSETSGEVGGTKVAPALAARAGVMTALGPGDGMLGVGYLYAPVDTDAVSGNVGGADLSLGYRLAF